MSDHGDEDGASFSIFNHLLEEPAGLKEATAQTDGCGTLEASAQTDVVGSLAGLKCTCCSKPPALPSLSRDPTPAAVAAALTAQRRPSSRAMSRRGSRCSSRASSKSSNGSNSRSGSKSSTRNNEIAETGQLKRRGRTPEQQEASSAGSSGRPPSELPPLNDDACRGLLAAQAMIDAGFFDGHWTLCEQGRGEADWLQHVTINGDRVLDATGEEICLQAKSNGVFLCGGLLRLDHPDVMCRLGKSGKEWLFVRDNVRDLTVTDF